MFSAIGNHPFVRIKSLSRLGGATPTSLAILPFPDKSKLRQVCQSTFPRGALRQNSCFYAPCIISKNEGVDLVCFGKLHAGSRELSDLFGIDLGDGQLCCLQGFDCIAIITTYWLKNETFDPFKYTQENEQIGKTRSRVGKAG